MIHYPRMGPYRRSAAGTDAAPGSPSPRVLVVGGSESSAAAVEAALRAEGMAVTVAPTARQAIAGKARLRPDVVLLDLGPPSSSGPAMVERFAADGDCGIVTLGDDLPESERIAALEAGADDFVAKPVPPRELAARIRALHRRLARPSVTPTPRRSGVVLDCAHRRLTGPGRISTPLTEAEFAAFITLLEADGASVSRDWLGRVALKRPLAVDDRSVDQLVLKLRRKLAMHGVTHRSILASRGLGYVIPEPGRFAVSATLAEAATAAAAPD